MYICVYLYIKILVLDDVSITGKIILTNYVTEQGTINPDLGTGPSKNYQLFNTKHNNI